MALKPLPAAVRGRFEDAARERHAWPMDATRVGRLGMMLHAHGQYRSAEACYEEAHQLERASKSWVYLLGVVQAESGDTAAAVESFRAVVKIDSRDVAARLRLADALFASADFDASLSEYTTLVRDIPDLPTGYYGLGRIAAIRGQPDRAEAHYLRAVELSPQFGAAHYALALLYRDGHDASRARQHLEAFRRWGPLRPLPPDPLLDEVLTLKSTARDLIAQGTKADEHGNLQESIRLHLQAIDEDPAAGQAHVNLISLFGRLGDADRAERHYRAALETRTSLADAHYNYGVLLASGRSEREAAAAFARALEANPFHAQAHNNLATLLARLGRLDEALLHFQHAVANDPDHEGARYNLARSLLVLGRPREAIEHLERIRSDGRPESARVSATLAGAWLALNEKTQARSHYERALTAARAVGDRELTTRIEHALQALAVVR
jgi:tetratricopeptide (TPR) repeat protein